ncbi:hypothetical protein COX24_00510 [bacterium (Candidatus Gribaldobacteria) CG23_combo_of_CG06-09_8_20_14_all_37_87_8]|uniref:Type II secretion system protein GspF domain-containing protein n=2 Tax=Candidatus Gribaldobacteria TaxID=2798536 RepID=A0A2G9ZHG2_9BACT|nr:MAG: hypothetical protein AUJ25_02925 [Parcubacteria group bacterium CG1_02_37_13]PIP32010.1 MAG: hypothetical protein COX24_00510 [bacterium (Candidatus Gribaldobacteria) CG23_combo_of_CG06-09_8_20_14_all_37_87_8]PIR90599.1 MAG: hypothetical protein COU05_01185 [bacterium (Candidatus Gribaldobacteria) CG10_big_fil_rev_8_21_14_0_10_37_21]
MKFIYKARSKQGDSRKGTIGASSRKVALDLLEKNELYATSLIEAKSGFNLNLNLNLSFLNTIGQKDKIIFTRQFAVMLKSAIPPLKALRSQVQQTRNPNFRERILKMAESIETGSSLSQAFALHSSVFNPFFISMIKSGEATGKVADSLMYLAKHMEKDYNLRQKVKGALIYPGFIIVVFVGAFLLTMLFIVPKLTEILKGFGGKLPIATRVLMWLSDFIRQGGWVLIFVALLVLGFSPILMKRWEKTRRFYDKVILELPIFGKFFRKIYLIQFSENLSVLMKAGLPITQALSITRDIIDNTVYKDIIQEAGIRVAKGEKISAVLEEKRREVFPFVTQMVSTGEETGRLDSVLGDVVSFYSEEVERTADNLTTLLEPFLILSLGIGVGILAIAIFVPLFKIGMGGETLD